MSIKGILEKFKKALPDTQEISLRNYFKRNSYSKNGCSKNTILVQCVDDPCYFGLLGQIATSLKEGNAIQVQSYMVRCLNTSELDSLYNFIRSRFFINFLSNIKCKRLYSSFCDSVGFHATSIYMLGDLVDFYCAFKIWRSLETAEQLIEMKIENIDVGDLLNDTFLRYKPAPTINVKDRFMLVVIWQAFRYFRRSKKYFIKIKPRLYLNSYSTYIQHGIPVRVAIKYGIPVFGFGNVQDFSKKLTENNWMQTKNPFNYARDFMRLDQQDSRLELAEIALSKRFSGANDSATAYMKKSAYLVSDTPVPYVKNCAIIFLHDFYDSPNIYTGMVFPDFWKWICFTIDVLIEAKIPFYLKPHPNQVDLSGEVIVKLKNLYPSLKIISQNISNKQLVDAGILCGVTVYGTVAHELAFFGIPTIGCAHHPHIDFTFCKTASTKSEYESLLRRCLTFKVDKVEMRRQSLIFYYMHNLNLSTEQLDLNNMMMDFRRACSGSSEKNNALEILMNISKSRGYRQQLLTMMKAI